MHKITIAALCALLPATLIPATPAAAFTLDTPSQHSQFMLDDTYRSAYETSLSLLAQALELDPGFDFHYRSNHHFWYPETSGSLTEWSQAYMRASLLSADRLGEKYPRSDDAPLQGYYSLEEDPKWGGSQEGSLTVATVAKDATGPIYGVTVSTSIAYEGEEFGYACGEDAVGERLPGDRIAIKRNDKDPPLTVVFNGDTAEVGPSSANGNPEYCGMRGVISGTFRRDR